MASYLKSSCDVALRNGRRLFTRLRLAAWRSFWDGEMRDYCPCCGLSNTIEHLLLHCASYALDLRRSFFDWISTSLCPNFDSLSDPEKVRFLLDDTGFRSHAFEVRLYKFLASLFKLRDQAKIDPATTVSVEWGEERIGDSSAVLLDRPP